MTTAKAIVTAALLVSVAVGIHLAYAVRRDLAAPKTLPADSSGWDVAPPEKEPNNWDKFLEELWQTPPRTMGISIGIVSGIGLLGMAWVLRRRSFIQFAMRSPELRVFCLLASAWMFYLVAYDPWAHGRYGIPALLSWCWPIWKFGAALDAFRAGPLTVLLGLAALGALVALSGWVIRGVATAAKMREMRR